MNNKKLYLVVSIAVLIGLFFGITFGVIASNWNSPESSSVKVEYVDDSKSTEVESETYNEDVQEEEDKTLTRIDTWKTFTDNQYYNLEFKYPSEYQVKLDASESDQNIQVLYTVKDSVDSKNESLETSLVSIDREALEFRDPNSEYDGTWEVPEMIVIDGKECLGEAYVSGDGGAGGSSTTVSYIYEYSEEVFFIISTSNSTSSTWCAEPGGAWSEEGCESIAACEYADTCSGFTPELLSKYETSETDLENAVLILESLKFTN